MELRHLRYFVAVAEELHFRRAAERLHVAQPALSEQIRKLEDELGVKLFERTQRKVSITSAGAAMLDEARRVLRQAAVAVQEARDADERHANKLRIGYMPDSIPAYIPRALQRLTANNPNVRSRLEPGQVGHLIEAVKSANLDAAIINHPAPTNGMRVTSLGTQGAVSALPLAHANALDQSIDLARMAPSRILVPPREANSAFHNAVVSTCHGIGISPNLIEMEEPHVEHLLLAVAAGTGLALLPESAAERYATPGIRFVTLEGTQPTCETVVVTRRDSDSLATQAFLKAVVNSSARHAEAAPAAPESVRVAVA
jgi:DNA-binding transcriptional LysR family regulator